ncbi:GIY-YIG nuclease family protein [Lentilactobacillus sp. SPB1-3]|uniref:GIY-YIG nuclease family protein n=1 Tax=Lentilactobacillus terminaliae TaxID=3003483 RepID=A0ACD5DFI8_9LACO|nr:GIY-YIG nuclease family protein [Lentilactobacillus sp. SPB1-3]MCZ0976674.1 GIY-YIG nuclease family protein [Lentilactobacillus sp. SPB1-3]
MNNKNSIRSIDDIFNDPDVNDFLKVKPKHSSDSYDPLIEGFQEINKWVSEHDGHEPQKLSDYSQIKQRKLASRLKGIRSDPERRARLLPYDVNGLLKNSENIQDIIKKEKKDFSSVDDIIADDSVIFSENTITSSVNKLFDTKKLKEVQRERENRPEVVSQRRVMKDFDKYRGMFKKVQAEISSGQRKLIPFKNYELLSKHFYVLKGQLLYIDEISEEVELSDKSGRKTDARMHVIYENGTENSPTRNGLAASLYGSERQGRIVTEIENGIELRSEDHVTGSIYILKSLSDNPQIKKIKSEGPLYKVGFTKGSVQKRIANAENEPTYLYGPVQIVGELKVININAESLETALHHALKQYRLNVDITVGNGRIVQPREWFVVDFDKIQNIAQDIVMRLQAEQE